jgi:hypothetical protein
MATFTEMLEQTRIVEAGALALSMACKSKTLKAEVWFHFFSRINYIMACQGAMHVHPVKAQSQIRF